MKQCSSVGAKSSGSQTSLTGPSSGYHSLNHSSHSPTSSSSSSPVERNATVTNGDSGLTDEKQLIKPSASVQPLSISNPLYSLQTVPLLKQHRSACQSLPDIQAAAQAAAQTPDYSQRSDPSYRLPLVDSDGILTPDSSFEWDQTVRGSSTAHPWQNSRPQPVSGLSSSLTPTALHNMLTRSQTQQPSNNSLNGTTGSMMNGSGSEKMGLPRTNPRYVVRSPRMGTVNRTSQASVDAHHQQQGSQVITVNGHVPATPKTSMTSSMSSAIRRTRTDGALSSAVNGYGVLQEWEECDGRGGQDPQRDLDEVRRRLGDAQEKLREAEDREKNWKSRYQESRPRWTDQVKPIIARLKTVEQELQEEVSQSHRKQEVIDSQQRKIESLLHANQKLMATLCHIKDKYMIPTSGLVSPLGASPVSSEGVSPPTPGHGLLNGHGPMNGHGPSDRIRRDSEEIGSPNSEESFESNSSVSSVGDRSPKATDC